MEVQSIAGSTSRFYCLTCHEGVGDRNYHRKQIKGTHLIVKNTNWVKSGPGGRALRKAVVVSSPRERAMNAAWDILTSEEKWQLLQHLGANHNA